MKLNYFTPKLIHKIFVNCKLNYVFIRFYLGHPHKLISKIPCNLQDTVNLYNKNIGSIISPKYFETFKTLAAKEKVVISFLEFQYQIILNFNKTNIMKTHAQIIVVQDKDNFYNSISSQSKQYFVEHYSMKLIEKQSILNRISPEFLQKDKNVMETMIAFLNNKQIPATNWTKLLLFERIYTKLKIPRGFVHDSLINHVNNNDDIIHKLIVHNAIGPGDVNFISEINQAYKHSCFITENLTRFKIREYHLLHRNKNDSDDFKGSEIFTGQRNCDGKLVLEDTYNKTTLVRYLDIKQKELDISLDTKHLYLKIDYAVNGFLKNTDGILNNIKHAHDYVKMCERQLSFHIDMEIQNFLVILKNTDVLNRKMILLHEFILLNAHNPKMRMTVMFSTNISPTESVFEDIAIQYASKMPDNIFSDQQVFNQFFSEITYKGLPQKIGTSARFEHMKKEIVENSMNEFKIHKSRFTPDFVEKNYTGFSDIINSKE